MNTPEYIEWRTNVRNRERRREVNRFYKFVHRLFWKGRK